MVESFSAAEWIARLSDNQELTPIEKAGLTDFLRASPIHVRDLIEAVLLREDVRNLPIEAEQLERWVAEARIAATGAIPFSSAVQPTMQAERSRKRHTAGRVAQIAAVLIIALTVGVVIYTRSGLYSAGFGELRVLTLADGSVVSLNAESKIKVNFSAHRRSIALLRGEAFFQVAHAPDRPFLVIADNATVRAVGTAFDVKLATQDAVVSIIDGVVNVSLGEGPSSVSVEPVVVSMGEEARIRRRWTGGVDAIPAISKIQTPVALSAASWTRGQLEFDDTPLAEVLAEFQHHRHFDVQLDGDATRALKLTGAFRSHDLESVLDYIATIPGVVVKKTGPESYVIRRS